jgi:hypothetical protein
MNLNTARVEAAGGSLQNEFLDKAHDRIQNQEEQRYLLDEHPKAAWHLDDAWIGLEAVVTCLIILRLLPVDL